MNHEYFQTRIDRVEGRKENIRRAAETMLTDAKEQRGATSPLTAGEDQRLAAMHRDLADCDDELTFLRAEQARLGTIPENLANRVQQQPSGRMPGMGRINCRSGAEVSPIDFSLEQLAHAHAKLLRQETAVLENRASNTASPLLPAQLFPQPLFPQHEDRIANFLPAFAADVPAVEYIRVDSVTGSADVVAEAALKPEIVLNVTKLVATCVKIAAHLGLTQESIQDFDAFTSSATTELQRLITDKENASILGWWNQAGILTHPAVNTPTFDDLEQSISELRSGPSLATADLLVLSPTTWSSIRREKDAMERYYVAPDPSAAEVDRVWGVKTVATTACPDGEGWLLDTAKAGRLIVRETLSVRIGFANDDFVKNIVRYVCELREVYALERPTAVLHLTGLAPVTPLSRSKSKADSK